MRPARPTAWLSCLPTLITSILAQSIPSPPLDLSALGQVAVGGNFDAIQLYTYQGQTQGLQGNSSRQSILRQTSNGNYEVVATTDAYISSMCALVLKNGSVSGIAVGGNFTSVTPVGGQNISAASYAFINGTTGQISPYPGLQGPVSSVLCDTDTETVYVGGAFDAIDSSNVVAWLATGSWSQLPFLGFDGPVEAITKGPNSTIVFGGQFTGLKNASATGTTSRKQTEQIINLPDASIQSTGNATSAAGIFCPSNNTADNWLGLDNTPASLTTTMQYGYNPSRLRLYNANNNGRGVKTFRFTALPLNGIMNLTYSDPTTGNKAYCDANCPLSQDAPYQDFTFVNTVGMNSFRIDVSQWYGSAAALAGVELYQNDTFSYAISALNKNYCLAQSQTISTATNSGSWTPTPSGPLGYADYLTANITSASADSTAVTFFPDVQEDGNYTVVVYTPGCIPDNTCATRGYVNITGNVGNDGQQFSAAIAQTNYYDKYDTIFSGKVSQSTTAFRPSFVLRAVENGPQTQTVVASRIRLAGNPSTGGLNGLYQFNPNQAVQDTDFSKSAINNAGTTLASDAYVDTFAQHNDTIYTGGTFSDDTMNNIMAFANNQPLPLPEGGLNAAVSQIYASQSTLYLGGSFSGTHDGETQGLSNVAAYTFSNNSWSALGAGLNGPVKYAVPLSANISGSSQVLVAFGGQFTQILSSSAGPAHNVDGLAIWVPSAANWYQNVAGVKQQLSGELSASTSLPNGTWYGGGMFTSLGEGISGAVSLQGGSNQVSLQQLPITIQSSSSTSGGSNTKRALLGQQNSTGVLAGAYNMNNNQNVTILGGHFTATVNGNNIQNLAFIDGKNGNSVTGLPAGMNDNSTFVALTMQSDSNLLLAGGAISGQVNGAQAQGLIIYDFGSNSYRSTQPAALEGSDVVVNSIAQQSGTSHMYVGGSFETTSQGLACSTVCMYDTGASTWNAVGGGLTGTATALYFLDNKHLLAAGDLTVNGQATSLAEYNIDQQSWSVYTATALPGAVSAFAPTGETNQFWASGTAQNGSTYLTKVNGNNLEPIVAGIEPGTSIQSMDVLQLNKNHDSSRFLDRNQDLLIMGKLNLTGFGPVSAAVFNGSTFTPFILATTQSGQAGSLNSLFYSKTNPALQSHHFGHSLGIAILVAFCAALGTLFLIFLLGILFNRIQRQRQGYTAVPQMSYQDKNMNINRVPPERLFGSVGNRTAPTV